MAKKKNNPNDRGSWRAIYSSLWDNPDFLKLSPEEKLVFINLRTSPLSHMPCIYIYYKEAISKHTGLSVDVIDRVLHRLSDSLSHNPWITYRDGIMWVRNGLKYDPNISMKNERQVIAIKNYLKTLPPSTIIEEFCNYYGIGYPIAYSIAERVAIRIKDKDKEKDKEKENNNNAEKIISFSPEKVIEKKAKEKSSRDCYAILDRIGLPAVITSEIKISGADTWFKLFRERGWCISCDKCSMKLAEMAKRIESNGQIKSPGAMKYFEKCLINLMETEDKFFNSLKETGR